MTAVSVLREVIIWPFSKATPYTSSRPAHRLALPAGESGELGQLGLRAQALERVISLGEHCVRREAVHGGVA